jgi:hypothetical protein
VGIRHFEFGPQHGSALEWVDLECRPPARGDLHTG